MGEGRKPLLEARLADVAPRAGDVAPDLDAHDSASLHSPGKPHGHPSHSDDHRTQRRPPPPLRERQEHTDSFPTGAGSLRPVTGEVFDGLDRIGDAHRLMESNTHTGKIVVTVRH
ncbi:zinc-binding dehydrogenase [Streptomyces sp. NBC_00370]|uniref:zinc-binding dehydrogenase n=1 Tax=Streptomyces sp. NBC_00370 TaxID=2975728 RepID=UPI002E259AD6